MWVSGVNSAQLHLTITLSWLNRGVNSGTQSKPLDHPQHHRHMLNCPLQAIPPAMQCNGVVVGTLAAPDS